MPSFVRIALLLCVRTFGQSFPPDCNVAEEFLPSCCPGGGYMVIPAIILGDTSGAYIGAAVIYLVLIAWCFIGVAIVSDVFMSAIEVITSQEKQVSVRGEMFDVKVWNDTVANLTLMALGSSAPEILLAVIELLGTGFYSGMLGPSTIVGSAAFNFFMISSICISSIPVPEIRLIEGTRVYACTCSFSILAYFWLYVIVGITSPNRVTILEGVLTLVFFPILVLMAWALDVNICGAPERETGETVVHARQSVLGEGMAYQPDGEEHAKGSKENGAQAQTLRPSLINEETVRKIREELMNGSHSGEHHGLPKETLARIRAQVKGNLGDIAGDIPEATLMRLIQHNVEALQGKRSRAYYRVNATRHLVGGKKVDGHDHGHEGAAKSSNGVTKLGEDHTGDDQEHHDVPFIEFESAKYSCVESCGTMLVQVVRSSDSLDFACEVKYKTRDLDPVEYPHHADAGADYTPVEGTLHFAKGEAEKSIEIAIVDDEEIEEDEVFAVDLFEPKITEGEGRIVLGHIATTMITIIDDDDPGILKFSYAEGKEGYYEVQEGTDREVTLTVERYKGSSGKVWCKWATEAMEEHEATSPRADEEHKMGLAQVGDRFHSAEGTVEFAHNATSREIKIKIGNSESYRSESKFKVVLRYPEGKPHPCSFDDGKDELVTEVIVSSDPKLMGKVDRLKTQIDAFMSNAKLGTNSWGEQFVAAVYVGGSPEDQAEATCGDWVMHCISCPWKVFFALVPPTDYLHGMVTFIFSLGGIAVVTAVVGDVASHLGCSIGMRDDITAITIVALGTSLPDTFASRTAAIQDPYADASIGNITGSNSVNVFLGLGLPWSMGAIYWTYFASDEKKAEWMRRPVVKGSIFPNYGDTFFDEHGVAFMVPAGTIGFSVMCYTCLALVAVLFLIFRRKTGGGELGGPSAKSNTVGSIFMALLWLAYIVLSIIGGGGGDE
jgi:solute carrier family 8 (sodium/calcium exchanger)